LVAIVQCAVLWSEGNNFAFMTRRQTTWFIGIWTLMLQVVPTIFLVFITWPVGEFFCRQRWPAKLAAWDAFFRGRWTNATFARSALRGLCAGVLAAGVLATLLHGLQRGVSGVDVFGSTWFGFELATAAPSLVLIALTIAFQMPLYLISAFLVPSWQPKGRIGRWLRPPMIVVSALGVALVQTRLLMLPTSVWLLVVLLMGLVPTVLFLTTDLFTALSAIFTTMLALESVPMLIADHGTLQLHGALLLLAAALPTLVSLRWLGSEREFTYTYDDIPPHVRRIAERERQRVELETAAGIQSSILPELPPRLNGVDLAYSYLPASEVGGDFYDVLALEDGRVALAIGDVAGHGVSSGLVMSMVKSALAVQVTYDPEIASVLATLNRMVHQGARQRLLTTLCYALIDPARGQVTYSSAGHLEPYRITGDGRVESLRVGAYPLGVRSQITPQVRSSRLEAGDALFLCSDGLVEACPEGSDEPFGFDRLEASLQRHAALPPDALKEAVLDDLQRYLGHPLSDHALGRQEDDLTILIARLPGD
ncbi:MAG: PP2C family protein-serine/threonine phosphatase, partial [Acidobacteriota bacterium]